MDTSENGYDTKCLYLTNDQDKNIKCLKKSNKDKHVSNGKSCENLNYSCSSFRKKKYVNKVSETSVEYNDSRSSASNYKDYLKSFIYGNFHFYYGYRNQQTPDLRLACLKAEWLLNKDVLDVGCNAGHFTLSVARDFSPRVIIGMDIDPYLVRAAKKNAQHYLTDDVGYISEFPISFISQLGPTTLCLLPGYENVKFPYNVGFIQGNYVLESDELLAFEEPKFDTIFCLSLTKWIQLNWGDEGLKRTFLRMYAQLRNGGHLILEAQPYSSYHKKKKITENTFRHYTEMQLFPEEFNEYLVDVVGFKTCELIDIPAHTSKGFSRPLYLFTKGTDFRFAGPKHIVFETNELDSSDNTDLDVEELSD